MKEIYLGLDLCKKNIQMSYYREDKQEPESIFQLNNMETYQLPNVMFYSLEEERWYVGNSVSTIRFKTEGVMVEDVLGSIDSDVSTIVNDNVYAPEELLLLLLEIHINEFLSRSEEYKLSGLTITIEQYHEKVYAVLQKLKESFSLSDEQFYIMSHENAFFQYVMNQDERLRNNSVAMFEYGFEGMEYYRIDRKHQGNTWIYYLSRQDMKEEMSYSMLFGDVEELDRHFAELGRVKMKETYISTVYLTGPGFNDNWIEESKKVVCDGRRVFMGQNLYTKGACYHARLGAYETGKDCILCTEGSIPFDIGVNIGDTDARNYFQLIALGGREWYNMKGKVTLFLDDTNRINMVYRDKITKKVQKEIIEIHGLPKRPPKTTKLSLEVELFDERMGAIVIRDVGFGKIYPTTNKIYRKEFSVGNEPCER
ncbi:MAG: hypothetical protein K2L07_01775 [Lachnospiraceae bacterium]|nr:hypothetical protein [Lachnospiraceae bacterium]